MGSDVLISIHTMENWGTCVELSLRATHGSVAISLCLGLRKTLGLLWTVRALAMTHRSFSSNQDSTPKRVIHRMQSKHLAHLTCRET